MRILIECWFVILKCSKTKLYDKCNYFTFPIVNFPFISSSVAAVYDVYLVQLIHCSRACSQYSDFLDIAQLMTRKLHKHCFYVEVIAAKTYCRCLIRQGNCLPFVNVIPVFWWGLCCSFKKNFCVAFFVCLCHVSCTLWFPP